MIIAIIVGGSAWVLYNMSVNMGRDVNRVLCRACADGVKADA